ncbi:hypothetical protein D3C76_1165360 [compost metagenome]
MADNVCSRLSVRVARGMLMPPRDWLSCSWRSRTSISCKGSWLRSRSSSAVGEMLYCSLSVAQLASIVSGWEIVGLSPLSGLAALQRIVMFRSSIPSPSKMAILLTSGVPWPVRILMTSSACIDPMIPGRTPNTPASPQLWEMPAGGGSGKISRRLADRPPSPSARLNTAIWPSNWLMAAYTSGLPLR